MYSRKTLHTVRVVPVYFIQFLDVGYLSIWRLYSCVSVSLIRCFTNMRVRCILADRLSNDTAILRVSAVKITS